MVISDKEKRVTAYHEARHTLVGMNLPETDPIHKVSIIPRGGALGVRQTLPNEDMFNLTREKARNFIAFFMGGRCAEELVFGEITNGASNDIEGATSLAHSMVCHWGMSKKLGPISFLKSGIQPFGPAQPHQDYSEKTAQEIDAEVHSLVEANYKLALKILKEKRSALNRLAEALIIWETLDYDQVLKLVAGEDIGFPIVDKGGKKKGQGKKKGKKSCRAEKRPPSILSPPRSASLTKYSTCIILLKKGENKDEIETW